MTDNNTDETVIDTV